MPRYLIEDRTRNKPGTSFAGFFVLWEVQGYPFPHKGYCGHYLSLAHAERAKRQRLRRQRGKR